GTSVADVRQGSHRRSRQAARARRTGAVARDRGTRIPRPPARLLHAATAEMPGRRSRPPRHAAAAPGNPRTAAVPHVIHHKRALRNRSALAITDTELKLIAAAASIGLNSRPRNGQSTPAAMGTPIAL